jgi:sulfur-oxidizing protein SoxX
MVSPAMARRVQAFLTGLCFVSTLFFVATAVGAQPMPADGRALFIDERKGNCSACHKTPTDATLKSASTIGPPLESIRQKYATPADRSRLRNAIWDSSKTAPNIIMPPYGKHRILTDAEIDAILAYLETL